MRVLVCPHELSIGGSQINAIDLAAGAAAAGHDVSVYGVPGPLVEYIAERGLRFIPARESRFRPAPARIAELWKTVRRKRFDLVHAYEWPPCLEAYYGPGLGWGVPIVCTVLSMSVMPLVPASIPLIMGTARLGEDAQRARRSRVWVLEPPIDVGRDHPGIPGAAFRRQHGVRDEELLLVSVSRLALELKLDALVRAIDAVEILAARHPVKLFLVGDGPAAGALRERAGAANRRLGREGIRLCGSVLDPREAYAAADVVLGMGSSALRALAIGRPVVVQGEGGFSEIFAPASLDWFLREGFYGMGEGAPGCARLVAQLEELLRDPEQRMTHGQFGRRVVISRFSLERAVSIQLGIYEEVRGRPRAWHLGDALSSAARAMALEVANHRWARKKARRAQRDELLSAARAGSWPPSA